MAKTMWKKVVVAGPLVMESIYPAVGGHDLPHARAAKRNLSSAAQQRMNLKYSYQKLELMLAANFTRGDLVVTLTYNDDCLPTSRADAESRVKTFRARLNARRRSRGRRPTAPLIMFWCTECKHGDCRYHHHCVINSTGDDYADIVYAWRYGLVDISALELSHTRNYSTLARYMCKEDRERPGLRLWHYTRTARKPEVETFRVDADTVLQIPRGVMTLDDVSERTEYGRYHFVKYIVIGATRGRKAGHRHRRSGRKRIS